MATFHDKHGRKIEIEVSDCSAEAYFSGKRIGDVQTTGHQDIDPRTMSIPARITGWDVDAHFRKAGIATELVKQLSDEIGTLSPGQPNLGHGGENALTEEGMGLTRHCQKLGYVFPFPDEN